MDGIHDMGGMDGFGKVEHYFPPVGGAPGGESRTEAIKAKLRKPASSSSPSDEGTAQ